MAGIAAFVGAKTGITVLTDIPADIQPIVDSLVAAGILGGSATAFVKKGEKNVTPTADPQDDYGNKLVPAAKPDIPSI